MTFQDVCIHELVVFVEIFILFIPIICAIVLRKVITLKVGRVRWLIFGTEADVACEKSHSRLRLGRVESNYRKRTLHVDTSSTPTILAQISLDFVISKYFFWRCFPREKNEEVSEITKRDMWRVGIGGKCGFEVCERCGIDFYPYNKI
jgi:hypothetical protein